MRVGAEDRPFNQELVPTPVREIEGSKGAAGTADADFIGREGRGGSTQLPRISLAAVTAGARHGRIVDVPVEHRPAMTRNLLQWTTQAQRGPRVWNVRAFL